MTDGRDAERVAREIRRVLERAGIGSYPVHFNEALVQALTSAALRSWGGDAEEEAREEPQWRKGYRVIEGRTMEVEEATVTREQWATALRSWGQGDASAAKSSDAPDGDGRLTQLYADLVRMKKYAGSGEVVTRCCIVCDLVRTMPDETIAALESHQPGSTRRRTP